MAIIVGLLAYAAAAVFGAPLLLTLGGWRMRYPRLALATWHGVFLSGLVAACGTLVISVVLALSLQQTVSSAGGTGIGGGAVAGGGGVGGAGAGGAGAGAAGAERAAGAVGAAVTAVGTSWVGPTALVLCGWGALAAVGALAALIFTRAEPMKAALRAANDQFMLLAAISAYRELSVGGVAVTFVESDVPAAVSLPGRTIVITSRMEAVLTPVQVRAVIEHERAHVVQRHGWIAQLVHLNFLCVPKLMGAREFEQATQLLIELIADDCAARVCGADAVGGALSTVGALTSDESMMLRAVRVRANPPRAIGSAARRRAATAGGRAY